MRDITVREMKNKYEEFGNGYMQFSIEQNGLSDYLYALDLDDDEYEEVEQELEESDDETVFRNYEYCFDALKFGYNSASDISDWLVELENVDDFTSSLIKELYYLFSSVRIDIENDDEAYEDSVCIKSYDIFSAIFDAAQEDFLTCSENVLSCSDLKELCEDLEIDEYGLEINKKDLEKLENIELNFFDFDATYGDLELFYDKLKAQGWKSKKIVKFIRNFYDSLYDYLGLKKIEIDFRSIPDGFDYGFVTDFLDIIDGETLQDLDPSDCFEQFKERALSNIDFMLSIIDCYKGGSIKCPFENEILRCQKINVEPAWLKDLKKLSHKDISFRNGELCYTNNQEIYCYFQLDV